MVYLEAQAFLQLSRHCEEILDVCYSLGVLCFVVSCDTCVPQPISGDSQWVEKVLSGLHYQQTEEMGTA